MKSETINLMLSGKQGQVHVSRPLNQLGSDAGDCPSSCYMAMLVQWTKRPIKPFLIKGLFMVGRNVCPTLKGNISPKRMKQKSWLPTVITCPISHFQQWPISQGKFNLIYDTSISKMTCGFNTFLLLWKFLSKVKWYGRLSDVLLDSRVRNSCSTKKLIKCHHYVKNVRIIEVISGSLGGIGRKGQGLHYVCLRSEKEPGSFCGQAGQT